MWGWSPDPATGGQVSKQSSSIDYSPSTIDHYMRIRQRELLMLAIGVFFTVVAWVLIEIYRIQIVGVLEKEIERPTVENYRLDVSVFDRLREKN